MGAPEESEEEKRARKRAARRARADRIEQNQAFLSDRTAFLIRQFGAQANSGVTGPPRFGPGTIGANIAKTRRALATGARPGSFSSGLFSGR